LIRDPSFHKDDGYAGQDTLRRRFAPFARYDVQRNSVDSNDLARNRPDAVSGDVPRSLGVSLAGKALARAVGLGGARYQGTSAPTVIAASTIPRRRGPGMVLRADVLASASMRRIGLPTGHGY